MTRRHGDKGGGVQCVGGDGASDHGGEVQTSRRDGRSRQGRIPESRVGGKGGSKKRRIGGIDSIQGGTRHGGLKD